MALTRLNTKSMPAGSVLQVKQSQVLGGESYSISTYGGYSQTGLSVTITPLSSNPTFLVLLSAYTSAYHNHTLWFYDSVTQSRILTGSVTANADGSSTHTVSSSGGPTDGAFSGSGYVNPYGTVTHSANVLYTPGNNSTRTISVYIERINTSSYAVDSVFRLGRNISGGGDALYNNYSPCRLVILEIAG